jgi:DNA-damage-inducible protein J
MTRPKRLHLDVGHESPRDASHLPASVAPPAVDGAQVPPERSVDDQAIPRKPHVPNATTRAAMEEARAIARARRASRRHP